jgi:hypothetical protein
MAPVRGRLRTLLDSTEGPPRALRTLVRTNGMRALRGIRELASPGERRELAADAKDRLIWEPGQRVGIEGVGSVHWRNDSRWWTPVQVPVGVEAHIAEVWAQDWTGSLLVPVHETARAIVHWQSRLIPDRERQETFRDIFETGLTVSTFAGEEFASWATMKAAIEQEFEIFTGEAKMLNDYLGRGVAGFDAMVRHMGSYGAQGGVEFSRIPLEDIAAHRRRVEQLEALSGEPGAILGDHGDIWVHPLSRLQPHGLGEVSILAHEMGHLALRWGAMGSTGRVVDRLRRDVPASHLVGVMASRALAYTNESQAIRWEHVVLSRIPPWARDQIRRDQEDFMGEDRDLLDNPDLGVVEETLLERHPGDYPTVFSRYMAWWDARNLERAGLPLPAYMQKRRAESGYSWNDVRASGPSIF